MSMGVLENHSEQKTLDIIRVFKRRLPSGRQGFMAQLGICIREERLLEIDQALKVLKARKPGASLSTLVCDAIVKAAKQDLHSS